MKIKKDLPLLFPLIYCTLGNFLLASSAIAQEITVDGTTNTTVKSDEQGNFTIEQGDRAGNNLFHSFGEFSVPIDGSASFNNEASIANIFSRVTGGNISQVNGFIQANGSANLFLINPAGIIFGDGAKLNLGGSFYGSSADKILFEDGEFSATDLDNPPLLTINAPIGFGFRDNPGEIVNRSDANSVGLQVNAPETLALIGGNVALAGGKLTAPGGSIELGGLIKAGTVGINNDGSLTFPNRVARGDVSLSDDSAVNVAGAGGGFIAVDAKNLEMTEGSGLVAGIAPDLGTPDAQAGDIEINATGDILINGENSDGILTNILNGIAERAKGNSGNIDITTTNLSITKGASISTFIGGQGNGGNITIKAKDTISLDGIGESNSQSRLLSGISGQGDAGSINVNTKNLSITNGASIDSVTGGKTLNPDIGEVAQIGQGKAGDINISATNNIFLAGLKNQNLTTGIFSYISKGGLGNAGDVEITTKNLSLINGSQISAGTFGKGNAGNVNINATDKISFDNSNIVSQVDGGVGNGGDILINTGSLSLTNEAALNSSTYAGGQGNAGDITIQAADSISLTNQSVIISNTTEESIGNAGKITIETANNILLDNSVINSQVANGVGNGDDINITTDSLSLSNKADLNTSASGQGNAGNVNIQAIDKVSITDNSTILAKTGGRGEAGNVNIKVENLLLRNQGLISTQSISTKESDAFNIGEANNDRNGGNINIDSNFVIAFPNQNNDIIANAQRGTGGDININAQAIFGLQEGKTIPNNSTNDIDASSEFGLSGTVVINTAGVNPRDDAREQPLKTVEAEEGVSQSCANNQSGGNNNLVLNGKGGVSAAPSEPLSSESIMMREEIVASPQSDELNDYAISTNQGKIIPARGIMKTKDGRIILIATPTTADGTRLPNGSSNCGQI